MKDYEVRVQVVYLDETKEDKDGRPKEVTVYKCDRTAKETDSIYDVLFDIAHETDTAIVKFEEEDEEID